MATKFEPRYDLYYIPEFEISRLKRFHRNPEKALNEFIETLTEHIRKFGLRNPVTVHRKDGRCDVRPGKCRVTARVRLGYSTVPVVLADFDKRGPELGWEPLPHDRTYIQNKYYADDCSVELDHRFFNVKKVADVVHRPGVQDQFAKDLEKGTNSLGREDESRQGVG